MLCVYECVSNIFRHDFFLYVCVYKYMYARTRAYKRTCTRMCVFVLAGMIYIFMDLYVCISNLLVVREAVNAASKSECLHLLPQTHQYPAR